MAFDSKYSNMSFNNIHFDSANVSLENLKIMLSNEKYSEICRICLRSTSNVASLFECDCDNITIAERITKFSLVEIEVNDYLPQVICTGCRSDLDVALEFKKRCEHSHELLKQLKNNIFIEDAEPVLDEIEIKKEENSNDFEFDGVNDDDDFDSSEFKTELDNYEEGEPLRSKNQNKQYCCKICKKLYKDKKRFQRHTKTAHIRDKAERESYTITGTGKERVFHCMQCEYSSLRKKHVEVHYRRHTGDQPHTCDLCPARYNQLSTLIRHKQTQHSDETPYSCEHCPKLFKLQSALKRHSVVHNTELPYKCEVCKKGFKWKHVRDDHAKRHEPERTLNCEVCGGLFISRVDLLNHRQIHLTDRVYSCNSCNFTTHVKTYLKRHIWTHTGVGRCSCKICGKVFSKKGNLTAHQAVHTDVRQFQCDLCDKKYKQRAVLKRHMMLHHGVDRNDDVPHRNLFTNKSNAESSLVNNFICGPTDGSEANLAHAKAEQILDNDLKNTN